ncbi:MAG: TIGR03084 family metal-binding protein [Alphaproteobacteria bacterium]
MLQQIADLREEAAELHALLDRLDDADWERETLFKRWTINDIVQHLHFGDEMGMASLRGPEDIRALIADVRARRESGLSRVEETRTRLGDPRGRRLLGLWRGHVDRLCEALAVRDPAARLAWAGPDMSVRMFATARQMEIWAHAQAIWDVLGLERACADRLSNIAVIGVKTFGWTFVNRGLPVPEAVPHVRLTAPSGAVWEWNDTASDSGVSGDAVAFCQVCTQTRNIADTDLAVRGDAAERWMALAQCFAGPPEDPPAPGLRRRAARPVLG